MPASLHTLLDLEVSLVARAGKRIGTYPKRVFTDLTRKQK